MSVPKKRKTLSKTKKGRSHQALKKIILVTCPQCKKAVKRHIACSFCKTYKTNSKLKAEKIKKSESKTN